ncbi:MAG: GatB/YqeY domain-containing protein [Gammaproteobacteria bacterium]|nr:GatB/YqeY domain-containing protein [Gammaproteobacteria bacterium]
MDTLKRRVDDDTKTALRAGDKRRLGTLRLILAAIKQREVDERVRLDDACVLQVLDKMVKQRKESLAIYTQAKRADLAGQEAFEIQIVQSYLPAPLDAARIAALVGEAIQEVAAQSLRDVGRVMGVLKPRLQGRADLSEVSRLVKERLAG